jgi:translocation and assembly module TamB
MSRGRRIALSVGVAVGIVAVLALAGLLVLTQTDWGREQVRRFAVRQLDGAAEGEVRIGRIEGNLLRRVRLVDVSIVDDQGRPFVRADTISTGFSLRGLLRQRLIFRDLWLINAEVVLDKPPGEDWNWVRIFPRDPEPDVVEPRRPGWGDWIEIRPMTLVNSRVVVRTEWSPPDDATPAERQKAIEVALSEDSRENVVPVPGGYQNVMDFRELNAELPYVRPTHPDGEGVPIEVARFSGIVQPFRPPPAVVHDLAGSFLIARDSLFFDGVRAVLPGSRLAADGVYALDKGDLFLRMHGAPVAFADLRWLYPPLPEEGGGSLRLTLHQRTLGTRIIAEEMDLRSGDATLVGRVDLALGDTVRLQDTDVRFERVDTRLIGRLAPDLDIPRQGELTGRLQLAGRMEAMQVDGDVTFADARAGTSRVLAVGQLGVGDEIRFSDLRLRFQPLQAELVRAFVPQLPMRGTIAGYANLTGVAGGPLQLDSDLTLRDPRAGVSRVRAAGGIDTRDELRFQNLRLSFDPLRTDLLRGEMPELPAGGTVAGRVRLHGVPRRQLQVDGQLALTDPRTGVSRVAARGGLGFGEEARFENLRVRLDPLQADFVRPWVPQLPAGSTLRGQALLHGVPARRLQVDGEVALQDPATGLSRVAAAGGIRTADELSFDDLRLRFEPLQLDLVRDFVPPLPGDAELPAGATLAGPLRLHGSPSALLRTEGDLTLRDPRTGVSRVAFEGGIETGDDLVLHDLAIRADPLRLDLVAPLVPDVELPAGATLQGRALLSGAPARRLRVNADLAVDDPRTGVSRVAAVGAVEMADELRFHQLDLRLSPLRLGLLRGFVPELPEAASVSGPLRLHGSPARELRLDGDLTIEDPQTGTSRLAVDGGVVFGDELTLRDMRLRADPLQLDLVRAWLPDLPAGATAQGTAWIDGVPQRQFRVDADLALRDPATGVSRVVAAGGIRTADELRFDDLRLRFDPLQVNLLRARLPDLPPDGAIEGNLRLDGAPERMLEVRGELTHRDPALGVSRVAASGGIGFGDEVRFRDLDLRFSPLRLELVRGFAPDLPVGGVLEGTATLTGSPAARLGFEVDLAHRWGAEHSQVSGRGEVVPGPQGWASVNLQLQPLSLATVGRFVPEAGLRGSVRGSLRAEGEMRDLAVSADLQAQDGGTLVGRGRFDLAAAEPGYDLDLRLRDFDVGAVTTRAPAATDLTGTVTARGRGTDPATMNAVIAADLVGSAAGDLAADEVRLRASIAAGLATFDRTRVRLRTAEAELDGSFGLVAGRHGELAYRVRVESLHDFAGLVPGTQQGVTQPAPLPGPEPVERPAELPERDAVPAGMAVLRSGGITRVQYPGAPRDPGTRPVEIDIAAPATADTVPSAPPVEPVRAAVPADSLAGRVAASGTLRGNVERFDASGTAEVEGLVVRGNEVGAGRAEYTLAGVGTPEMDVDLAAGARGIRAAGFEFDSATTRVRFRGSTEEGQGHAVLAAYHDRETDVHLDAEFALSLERNEVRLGEMALRFDTVTWQTTAPGVVAWGGAGVEVESLELRSNLGGRIFLDGRLPVDGAANLQVVLDDVEIGHLVDLAQADFEAEGRVTLNATVQGTQFSPLIVGDATLAGAVFDGRAWPHTQTTFEYRDRRLAAAAQLSREGQVLAVAEADLPVDLALTTEVEQRLLGGPIVVDVRADSLPLDAVPAFTDQVEDLRGRIMGNLAVRGTFDDPSVEGMVDLDLGSFYLVPTGIRFQEIAGTLRLQDDVVTVDSIVAWSDGPIRITGTIDLPRLTEPVFALDVEARNAWIIDTDDARLQVDADIEVTGTLAALEVEGDVYTRRGVIYIPDLDDLGTRGVVNLDDPGTFARIDTLFAAERRRMAQQSPLLENLQMDLAVHVDRDVWLRSIEANIEIYTPIEVGPLRVRMNGGPDVLALEGTINTDRGDYDFMGRRFRLTRGAVTFQGEPELNPYIQLVAEHEVRVPGREGFEIRVVLGGTLEDLSLAIESSAQPPISQTDLLSYLAFGRDASSLMQLQGSALSGEGGAAGGLVGNVAGLATQQLATVALDEVVRGLERDVAREIGLDVIRITPADLPPEVFTGSYLDVLRGTEVEAGRYITTRLFVAGQARFAGVPPGVRVEYRTPQGFVWTTTWQPRFLPSEPTLAERDPDRARVFGSFLFREWRF